MSKLPLYIYDHDLTYDLLSCGNIDENILNFLGRINNFPIGGINLTSYQINRIGQDIAASFHTILALFDRRTPDGFLWADNYSTKLYNFYKPLTTSGQYAKGVFSGNKVSEENGLLQFPAINHADILGDFLIEAIISGVPQFTFSPLIVENTNKKILHLTWFSPAFIENNISYEFSVNVNEENNFNVSNPWRGKIYNKIAYKLYPKEKLLIDQHCLLCSLVVSNEEGLTNVIDSQIPNYYFYKNFDSVFLQITNTIKEGFKKLGYYCSENRRIQVHGFFWDEGSDDPTDQYPDFDIDTWFELENSPSLPDDVNVNYPVIPGTSKAVGYYQFDYIEVPNWYYFAALIYGDPEREDLGKGLKFDFNEDSQLTLNFWNVLQDLANLYPRNSEQHGVFTGRVITPLPEQDNYEAIVQYNFDIRTTFNFEDPISVSYEANYDSFFLSLIDNVISKLNPQTQESQNTFMPDSQRVKEIHAALDAGRYAYYTEGNDTFLRVANLGYLTERIARVLGISVDPDGSIRSIRQSKHIKQGESIPSGWAIAQWGRNDGASDKGQKGGKEGEQRDGIAYDVISNRFTTNPFTGEASKIEEGGYVLCENFPQLLHVILDDLDKALGLQVAAANALPNADGKNYITYEGLHSLLAEMAFNQSKMSERQFQILCSSICTQSITREILAAFGVPIETKSVKANVEGEDMKIPYAGLDYQAPTMFNLFSTVLANIAPILLAVSRIRTRKQGVETEGAESEYPELNVLELNDILELSKQQEES